MHNLATFKNHLKYDPIFKPTKQTKRLLLLKFNNTSSSFVCNCTRSAVFAEAKVRANQFDVYVYLCVCKFVCLMPEPKI